jgi:hypothetical protein
MLSATTPTVRFSLKLHMTKVSPLIERHKFSVYDCAARVD